MPHSATEKVTSEFVRLVRKLKSDNGISQASVYRIIGMDEFKGKNIMTGRSSATVQDINDLYSCFPQLGPAPTIEEQDADGMPGRDYFDKMFSEVLREIAELRERQEQYEQKTIDRLLRLLEKGKDK